MNFWRFYYLGQIIFVLSLFSCESTQEREKRIEQEEANRVQEEIQKQELAEEKRKQEEKAKKEQEEFNKYISNSLETGATPYSTCFGKNSPCVNWGCSEIKVQSPQDSDVVVSIKSGNRVIRHAYIRAGFDYTFQLPNGKYQPFFYYGKGWNPQKEMPSETCENLKGGFISETQVGKDDPQTLNNDILTYSLILQKSGNFSTRPSSESEAF